MATPPLPTHVSLHPRALKIIQARRRARFVLLALLMGVFAAIMVARGGSGGQTATDHQRFHQGRFVVIDAASGDLLRLAEDTGEAVDVRLIGVDANGAPEARQLLAAACGEEVLLYLEIAPTRNHAGELLAYVYAADGTLVNGRLIESGWAFADRRWDYSFLRTFLQLEEQAYSRKAGFWPSMLEERMPQWRRRWLAEMRKQPWERQEWRRADEP